MKRLKGKIALVTSSTRGIGLACAKKLASEGAIVYMGVRRLETTQEICDTCKKEGLIMKPVFFDAYNIDSYKSMVEEVISKERKIDILVNNFGTGRPDKDLDLVNSDEETFFELLESNIGSVYRISKLVVPYMIENGGGSIINISTIGSIVPDLGRLGYVVSKSGVNALTENIAVQYARHNIRCNAVLPGLIATDAALNNMSQEFIDSFLKHVPLNRFGLPTDIANAVLFLASDESSFITGEILSVAGGFAKPSPLYGDNVRG